MSFYDEIYDALTDAGLLVEEYGAIDSDTFPQYQIRYLSRIFDDNSIQVRLRLDVVGYVPEPYGDGKLEDAMTALAKVLLAVPTVAVITETLAADVEGLAETRDVEDRYISSVMTVERVPD